MPVPTSDCHLGERLFLIKINACLYSPPSLRLIKEKNCRGFHIVSTLVLRFLYNSVYKAAATRQWFRLCLKFQRYLVLVACLIRELFKLTELKCQGIAGINKTECCSCRSRYSRSLQIDICLQLRIRQTSRKRTGDIHH